MSLTISIKALLPLIQLLKYVIKIIWNMLESSIYSNKEEKIFELLIHYFCSLTPFMFASVIDLIVSLENDGIITNYMAFYLQRGEMYLSSPWSTAICYWDGVIHYAFYWIILYCFHTGFVCLYSIVALKKFFIWLY